MSTIIKIFISSVVVIFSALFTAHAKETVPKLLTYETINTDTTSDEYWSGVVPYSDLNKNHKRLVDTYQRIILIKMANQMGIKASDYRVIRRGIFEESSLGSTDLYYETLYKSVCEVNIISVRKNGDYEFYTTLC